MLTKTSLSEPIQKQYLVMTLSIVRCLSYNETVFSLNLTADNNIDF